MSRNDQGRFAADHGVDPEAVLTAMDASVPYTTGEVARLVDAPRRTVLNYLSELHDRGEVRRKDPNERLSVWWIDA